MAQANKFTITSTSESIGIPENYADKIFHLAPWETQLLTAIGMDSLPTPCTQPVYHYLEIEDRPARTTLNGAIDSSTTTVVLTNAVCAAGEVIQVDEETILLGTTSDNLTFSSCTRSHGTTAGAAHLTLAPVCSLGKPRAQGAAAGSVGDRIIQANDVTNYTQIWSKDVIVSGTSQAVDRYGREGDEMSYQEMFQNKVIKKEMQNALIWNKAVAASTTSTAGEMDGIFERIQSTSNTDLGVASLTLDNVEDAVEACQDYGGRPNVCAVGLYQKRVIDSWGAPYVDHPTAPNAAVNMTYGVNVTKLYVGGVEMDVLVCPDIHSHVFILDTSKIGFGPLQGRALFKQELDRGGDRLHSQIIGEYTAAVANPQTQRMFSSLKIT